MVMLVCISLMSSDVEHLLMCFSAILISSMIFALHCGSPASHLASLTSVLDLGLPWTRGAQEADKKSSLAFGIRYVLCKYFLHFVAVFSRS